MGKNDEDKENKKDKKTEVDKNDETFYKIKRLIENSDMILVGCGEELSFKELCLNNKCKEKNIFKSIKKYGISNEEDLRNICADEENFNWIMNSLVRIHINNIPISENFYNNIYELIADKKYFIISTNTDNLIYQSKLDNERIVTPYGRDSLFQCAEACCNEVWSNNEYIEQFSNNLEIIVKALKENNAEKIREYKPVCKKCGKPAEFNIKKFVKNYVEEGYISQWNSYMKWIQKTLNKKVVIIELGENFVMPTIMRWPFEKIVYFNNKARMIRVNKTFPQISEEISDKALSLNMNSIEFLDGICKTIK